MKKEGGREKGGIYSLIPIHTPNTASLASQGAVSGFWAYTSSNSRNCDAKSPGYAGTRALSIVAPPAAKL